MVLAEAAVVAVVGVVWEGRDAVVDVVVVVVAVLAVLAEALAGEGLRVLVVLEDEMLLGLEARVVLEVGEGATAEPALVACAEGGRW